MEHVRELIDAEPERHWIFVGKASCFAALDGVLGGRAGDMRLLLPGDEAAANRVDAVLAEPYTFSRLLETVEAILARPTGQAVAAVPAPGPVPAPLAGHVLLVEDNRINQMVAARMLARLGLSHDIAEDGRVALEKLRHGDYDLVLMDMQMPVMDGIEATVALRALEAEQAGRRRLPVIAMTANAMSDDRERCLACGMDDHLAKPVELEKLAELLGRWLRRAAEST
jgi:CheY-like chemotaxis protein